MERGCVGAAQGGRRAVRAREFHRYLDVDLLGPAHHLRFYSKRPVTERRFVLPLAEPGELS